MMNRVLFLDVDGVLNNGVWAAQMYEQGVRTYRDDILYEPSLEQLKRIIDSTGAKIVVSSAWRQVPTSYQHLLEWLTKYGLEVYDKTPYVGRERGDDITAWFSRHPGKWQYVILDDDCDMAQHMDHLIQTNFDAGLTERDADRCIEILNADTVEFSAEKPISKRRKAMFYITGDTHGDFPRIEHFCERVQPSVFDTMIILGDAGFNYYGNWRDQAAKERMASMPLTVFSIHGNHEMRPATIPSYHIVEWHGGKVYVEDEFPNLLFAIDGEIYDLNGIQMIVIGGAYSIDKQYRLASGYNWWPDEQPSAEIKARVEQVLEDHKWQIDVVLSHTVPLKYEPVEVFMAGIDQRMVDKSTEKWLDMIEEKLCYKHWYAGHYHTEKVIDRLTLLFESIEEFKV